MNPLDEAMRQAGEKLISTNEFNEFLRKSIASFREKRDEEVGVKMVLLLDKGNPQGLEARHAALLELPPEALSPEINRNQLMFSLGVKTANEGFHLAAAFFISEGWIKMKQPGEEVKKGPVKDMAGSKEAVVIIGRTLDGRSNMGSLELKKDEDGSIEFGEEMLEEARADTKMVMTESMLNYFFKGYMATVSGLIGGMLPFGGMNPSSIEAIPLGGNHEDDGEDWKKGKPKAESQEKQQVKPSKPSKTQNEKSLPTLSDLDGLLVCEKNSPLDKAP